MTTNLDFQKKIFDNRLKHHNNNTKNIFIVLEEATGCHFAQFLKD